MRRSLTAVISGIALLSLAPTAEATQPNVINGTPNPPLASAAVYFETDDSSCTGTLLLPNLIVTAAHCFLDEAGNLNTAASDVVVWEPGVNTDTTSQSPIQATQILYNPAYRNQEDQEGLDLAFIVLNGALGTPRVTRVATQSEVVALANRDAVVSQVGYGQTVPRADANALPSSFPIGMSAGIDSDYSGGAKFLSIGTNGVTGTCAGDSGSPWMAEVNGQLLLVGVTSSGDNPPCEPASDGGSHDYLAVVSGQGDLLAQAQRAAGATPAATATTCLKAPGFKPECASGTAWTYDFCWDVPRYRLEKLTGSTWQSVTSGTGKRYKQCGRKSPYRITVSSTVDAPTTKYRLVLPRQPGLGRAMYDPFTVTSS